MNADSKEAAFQADSLSKDRLGSLYVLADRRYR
jgi:hypothetical protein